MKDDKEEKQILDQTKEPNIQENEEDKFDMRKYLEKERKKKILTIYIWFPFLIILAGIIFYAFYGGRLERLDEKALLILTGALIATILVFIVVKKIWKDTRQGQKDH